MDPLVRASVHLQKLALRLAGFLVAALLAAYLVVWAKDPPPDLLNALVLGVLLVSVAAQARRLLSKKPADLRRPEVDLGLFASLTVLTYAGILQLPGGLQGPYYAAVYALMMIAAAYCRPPTVVVTVLFASATEAGLRVLALGEAEWMDVWPRALLLGGFAALNSVLFRGEISRVRRVSRSRVEGEIERLKEAARAYRLTSGDGENQGEQGAQSAAGEMEHASQFALAILHQSLGLKSAILLSIDGARLSVFDAVTDTTLGSGPFQTTDGIFSAVLRRKETISISGSRASHHALVYQNPEVVGALSAVPILEGDEARGILLVDRNDERPFTEAELLSLTVATRFLLRTMQNERIFSSLTRASREQAKLYRAAEALSAATTEVEVIEAGVESAREVAAFDFAAVTLFHRKTSTHEICAVSGEGAEGLVDRSFRHNAGLVSMVVANRHPLPYRGDYDPSRQTVFARGFEPPKMPSLFVLPLMVHDRVLGTLVLGSSEKGAFSQSVRPALEVLASHMAVSLSNARMLKRLEEQATTDGMTGLLNKRTLIREAEKKIKSAARFKKPLTVLVTDIDHFKNVNDTYGHDIGDVVIKGLGDVLRRIKRDTDIVGRFGGEEFVVVCEQTDEEGGKNLAERIRRELENTTFQTELGPISVTCSVGVAPFPVAGQDWAQLFKATDEALYVSKRSGRNQVTVWSPRLRATSAA